MEPNPLMHTTTTGGNPVVCAATLAQTIRIEPALTIPYELIDEMLKRLEETFESL